VFFCGAGISYYTGLPGFKGLVEQVFEACGHPVAPRGDEREPRDTAFHRGQFDRALHLLEKDCGALVRRNVVELLIKPPPCAPDLHKALLDLARLDDGGIRLVTTNFDDRFDLAEADIALWQAAPRLGPPHPDTWRHLTYVHGRIDAANDPAGKDLVPTSGDFGRAYLKDAWAARFVVELFREFTVLFVGYSLDDPILGYLVHALAADMGAGGRFRQAFVLAGHKSNAKDRQRIEAEWKAKGVQPILFPAGRDGKHFRLHDETLKEWARQHAGGLKSRINDAIETGLQPYVVGREEEAANLAWALSKRDGSVAKAFADAEPSPDISWLEPLSKVKLFWEPGRAPVSLFDMPSPLPQVEMPSPPEGMSNIPGYHIAPIAGPKATCLPGLNLSQISFHLGRWLAKLMDKKELVAWVIARQGIVHPNWRVWLREGLASPPEPYRSFWELIIDGGTVPPCTSSDYMDRSTIRRAGWDEVRSPGVVLHAARSYLKPGKNVFSRKEKPEHLSDLARFDLELADAALLRDLKEQLDKGLPHAVLIRLADGLTSRLAEALVLARRGQVWSATEGSYSRIPSIASSTSESHYGTWVVLVELCRDAFLATFEADIDLAEILALRWQALWQTNRLHLFQRLALFACGHLKALHWPKIVDFLLADHGLVLWSLSAWPEVAPLLRQRAGDMDEHSRERLITAITDGPSRETFHRFQGTEEQFAELTESVRPQRLGKLAESGIDLPPDLKAEAERYLGSKAAQDHSDEIPYKRAKAYWGAPATAIGLEDKTPDEIADLIIATTDGYNAGNILKDLASRERAKALDVVDILVSRENVHPYVWSIGLSGFRDADADLRNQVILRLESLSNRYPTPWFNDNGLDAAANLLSVYAKAMTMEEEISGAFWRLWSIAWTFAESKDSSDMEDQDDYVTVAINTPGGNLAEALMDRLFAREIDAGSGFPGDLADFIRQIGTGASPSHRYARILMAARLPWLHPIDPEWVRDQLIWRMTWPSLEAVGMWQGFLWAKYWTPELWSDIRDPAIGLVQHLAGLPEEIGSDLYELLASILINAPPSALPQEHRRQIFAVAKPEHLQTMAWYFWRCLTAAGTRAATLWDETLAPIFQKNWPTARRQHSDETGKQLLDILLSTREAFSEAVQLMLGKTLIRPSNQDWTLATIGLRLDGRDNDEAPEYDYAGNHPRPLLELVNAVIGDVTGFNNPTELRDILGRISQDRLDEAGLKVYRRLEALL